MTLKSIKECSREERLERALLAIEIFAMNNQTGNNGDWDKVYMIAHTASGRCCSQPGWIEMIEECEVSGKELKLYDVEECLGR